MVVAQLNITTQATSALPPCAVNCTASTLTPAGCALDSPAECFCTNETMRAQLSGCLQTGCNRNDQFVTTTVLQTLICKGVTLPSRAKKTIQVITVMSTIAFLAIILRLCSRVIISTIWWDDWAIIFCGICMVPMTAFPLYSITQGLGKHLWDIPPQNIDFILELYYVAQIFYALVQTFAKISILFLLLRIFPDKRFRLVTKIFIGWMICQTLAFFFSVTLQCIPIQAVWNITTKGECINSNALLVAGAALSIFEDLVIIVLPIHELKRLNLSLKTRLEVILMFALGSFACIASIIRLKYLASYEIQPLDLA
ncbi:uncharacterized protein TRUGW13939_00782 [Talaromyces rugulosus]|uniref:CFEM domain-containing protein n=1 Tax=Talaromyces rugulosus TaxID=121627 RepID=A0A7H8QJ81_TALRU|nr:uncharacterized protein TRUGW13939_00782 [Talaromyces rugulosus]QKX53702.1 hypothetical protein TRUGW13939_00782 [Talaromyces rugulosus]